VGTTYVVGMENLDQDVSFKDLKDIEDETNQRLVFCCNHFYIINKNPSECYIFCFVLCVLLKQFLMVWEHLECFSFVNLIFKQLIHIGLMYCY